MPLDREASTSAVLTVPNALSFARILAIPAFVWLIVHRGTEGAGLLVFGVVASTDWVDGYIARRLGQVSELGKLLDPVADRLAIGAVLVALVVRDVFPLWAALLIGVRDGAILVVGAVLVVRRDVRIDVRTIGKAATFALMLGVPLVAWGELELQLWRVASIVGWTAFSLGIVLYYVAAVRYAFDVRHALACHPGAR